MDEPPFNENDAAQQSGSSEHPFREDRKRAESENHNLNEILSNTQTQQSQHGSSTDVRYPSQTYRTLDNDETLQAALL